MKKWLWIALTAAMMGCAEPEGAFTIKGKLDNQEDAQLHMIVNNRLVDTIDVRNGRFTIRGRVDQPELAALFLGPGHAGVIFFLEPGKLKITGDLADHESKMVTGSPLNDKFFNAMRLRNSLINKHALASENDQAAIGSSIDSMQMAFMDANLDNLAGVLWFKTMLLQSMDAAQIESTIARFTPEMQRTSLMDDVRAQLAYTLNATVGSPFTEVAMPDRNGKTITLSDVVGRNRYVLLDFWASWCGPCLHELPYLKSAYERFQAKGFEIYGVTLDTERDLWMKTLDVNGMNWLNVGSFESSRVPAMIDYRVTTIPTNFLISRDGTIIARDLRGDSLPLKLEELLR